MEQELYKLSDELTLTDIRKTDVDALCLHINDIEIYKNTLSIPFPYKEADAVGFIMSVKEFEKNANRRSNYAIRMNGEMMGGIGLLYNYGLHAHKSEIGYWISPHFRGKGIMTKILKSFIRICFEEKQLSRLEANVYINNIPSQKLLETCGFSEEGLLRDSFLKEQKFISTKIYGLLKRDLPQYQ